MALALCCTNSPKVVYYDYDTGSLDTIYKEVITHKILNPELKRLLIEYNDTYKDDPRVKGLGLYIHCYIHTDSILYIIGYSFGINHILGGLIICEPIDGKDVFLIMKDLHPDFSLSSERSIEILKNSNPEEYLMHKEMQKSVSLFKGKILKERAIVIFDYPEWHVIFDRNNNLLRVEQGGW